MNRTVMTIAIVSVLIAGMLARLLSELRDTLTEMVHRFGIAATEEIFNEVL